MKGKQALLAKLLHYTWLIRVFKHVRNPDVIVEKVQLAQNGAFAFNGKKYWGRRAECTGGLVTVVVKNGTVIGKGWHHKAGMPHAEVEAINDAGAEAKDATIYVTLEPCNHTGRTPPCTQKILETHIFYLL